MPKIIYLHSSESNLSRVYIIKDPQSDLTLVILEPYSKLASEVLEGRMGTFPLTTNYEMYPKEYQGPASLKFPKLPSLQESSFDLAIPLQSFGSIKIFSRSEDFPRRAFGCEQPLHISMMFQDALAGFDLGSVLKANFHQELFTNNDSSGSSDGQVQNVSIKVPFLFYIKSTTPTTTLVHLFGRVGQL